MSTRDWKMRTEDILEAIQRIEEYTRNIRYQQWQKDQKTIDAVVRNIEIIGEATRHIPEEIQQQFANIPWTKMKGMRNILIHEYFGVDNDVLWKTIQNDLPSLKALILETFDGKSG